jgi:hypothetical protein
VFDELANLPSMPQYVFVATNVGAAATSGEITFTDTLPPDLTVVGARGSSHGKPFLSPCDISGQTVTCTSSRSILPGDWFRVIVALGVPAVAPPSVTNHAIVAGGGAGNAASTTDTTTISSTPAPFEFLPGLPGLRTSFTASDGSAVSQAGAHPFQLTVDVGLSTTNPVDNVLLGTGPVRDVGVKLPQGLVVNPAATPVLCTEAQLETDFASNSGEGGCPDASQIGIANVLTSFAGPTPVAVPLYNMVPPPGVPGSLAFDAVDVGVYVHLLGGLDSAGDYALTSDSNDILAKFGQPLLGIQTQLWGDPSDPSHDGLRGLCHQNQESGTELTCPVPETHTPLLTMPTACGAPLVTDVRADSWTEPGVFHPARAESVDGENNPVGLDGCNALEFEPKIDAKPTTNLAESPSGLDFNLHQRQNPDREDLATAPVKDLTIALPQGMTLNPAAADGLGSCTSAQIGLTTAIGQSPAHFSKNTPNCPGASRLGMLEVNTPVFVRHDSDGKVELDAEGNPIPDPLSGSVYLAKPFDNPFNSLLAIYLTVEAPEKGIIAKVPAEITADPQTGQLVTKISNNPELPLEDVSVHLFGGARGPLITPPLCGDHTTTSTFTPWSTPEGQDAHPASTFATTAFPGGGNCPTSPGQAPNSPSFSAGTIAPVAGAYSPFTIKLNREDGSQRLTGVSATLPPGLIGKLAGVAQCSEAQIAAAKAREVPNQGAAELVSPSCPASSEVGVLDVSAGAGPTPFHVGGHAYLSGPYKGAPLSLTVITPAIAGPFDLGTTVIRVALNLDPQKAQIHAVSDPFPTVLEGIPLDVRGASLRLGRPDFTLNPTSCDPMAIEALTSTIPGQLASLRSPFQVGGCSGLGFKPGLALQLKGGTRRGGHPGLIATYRPRPGDANLAGLLVRLPRSAFLDQAHIRTICTRVQFAAKACPKGAQYGYIKAFTPLLDEPLEGPVWLRSSNHKLPDLVFDLHGLVDVEVATRIDSSHGGIRARIESSPDAPLSKVVLRMQGAKKGLIVNSRNLCGATSRANVELTGQNGKESSSNPVMQADCGGKHGHKRHHGHT